MKNTIVAKQECTFARLHVQNFSYYVEKFCSHVNIVIFKTFLSKETYSFYNFQHFINYISKKVGYNVIKKLIATGFLMHDRTHCPEIFMNLNFQDIFFRELFLNLPPFPMLQSFYLPIKRSIYLNNCALTFAFDQTKNKGILIFLNQISKNNIVQPSLQLALFLKTIGMIEEAWVSKGIKVTKKGLKLLFESLRLQFMFITENFSKTFSITSYRKCLPSNCYNVSYKKYITVVRKIERTKNFKFEKNINIDILKRMKTNQTFRAQIFHTFENNFIGYFVLFHSLEVLFFPCFFDKIFYTKCFFLKTNVDIDNQNKEGKIFQSKKINIIIESNYRIYVYKKEAFKNNLFYVFSDLLYKLPNFMVGEITENSISRAIKNGISVQNILGFINQNLHYVCSSIPSSVLHQIRLWEFEKKKMTITNCYLIVDSGSREVVEKNILPVWDAEKKFDKNVKSFLLLE